MSFLFDYCDSNNLSNFHQIFTNTFIQVVVFKFCNKQAFVDIHTHRSLEYTGRLVLFINLHLYQQLVINNTSSPMTDKSLYTLTLCNEKLP
jgi:hypothetical protein